MLKQNLSFKLTQKLSPQQIKLMKLIQLPTLDFEQRIKNEIEENELNYRLLRYQHGKRLKKISDVRSSLPRFNARCTMTGKDKVHNKWFRISTVPLRHMLREGLIPGWERANW